ncbi:hypothetical protein NQ314_015111 [Rhamnusium bicolor]|uniref:UBZ1-type domain-containing protein n=1 Tax=Rhamnusium bicolor TaxID=1586634 RepID=A0AAV8X1X2_9CUCU|nr:hypothetical protein NQ314_015111 [Rhamnusium bicolor]
MEESLGAQYAIQIAVHTLRDRCKSLQYRISVLEEENMNLRIRCSRNDADENSSLSELDRLKEHITELTEQKEQLHNKIKMVSNENQDLWSKLGKLSIINKNLDLKHLHKMNHKLGFYKKNLEINERISLELEDISLKLTDSFCKQKIELDKLCSEIEGIQYTNSIITENFGFCYEDELEGDLIEDIKCLLGNLNVFKEEVFQQKDIIQKNLRNLNNLREKSVCKACEIKKNGITDRSTSTSDIPKSGVDKCTEVINIDSTDLNSSKEMPPESEKVCPICTRIFRKDVEFPEFQRHVEDHFHPDIDTYELL